MAKLVSEYPINSKVIAKLFLDPQLRYKGPTVKRYFDLFELAHESNLKIQIVPGLEKEKDCSAYYSVGSNVIAIDKKYFDAFISGKKVKNLPYTLAEFRFIIAHELAHFDHNFGWLTKYRDRKTRTHGFAVHRAKLAQSAGNLKTYSRMRGGVERAALRFGARVGMEIDDQAIVDVIAEYLPLDDESRWENDYENEKKMFIKTETPDPPLRKKSTLKKSPAKEIQNTRKSGKPKGFTLISNKKPKKAVSPDRMKTRVNDITTQFPNKPGLVGVKAMTGIKRGHGFPKHEQPLVKGAKSDKSFAQNVKGNHIGSNKKSDKDIRSLLPKIPIDVLTAPSKDLKTKAGVQGPRTRPPGRNEGKAVKPDKSLPPRDPSDGPLVC